MVSVFAFEGDDVATSTADIQVRAGVKQMTNRTENRYGANIKDANVWLKNGPEGDGGTNSGNWSASGFFPQEKDDPHGDNAMLCAFNLIQQVTATAEDVRQTVKQKAITRALSSILVYMHDDRLPIDVVTVVARRA